MDDNDPMNQFFPGEEDVDLYAVLSLQKDASLDSIKKAYRKLALIYHPDKHATSSEKAKQDASTKFQQVGFAYAVLSDSKRKARYDSTGRTDEGFELGAGEDGWEAYFEELFDRVTRGKLDEMKKEYQGSSHYLLVDVSNQFTRTGSVEEIEAIKEAYDATEGNFGVIMTHIPHSTHEDEPRILTIITDLIKKKELKSTPTWLSTSKDEKGKMVRKKEADKEAEEAEELAKELGVWDEFYGSGKATEKKKGKSKGKGKAEAEEEEDHSALQALILKRKEKNLDNLFDNLAAKYSGPVAKGKGKKRGHGADEEEESSRKKMRSNAPPPPEIDDEEFAKIQKKLFGDKPSPERKRGKGRKTK